MPTCTTGNDEDAFSVLPSVPMVVNARHPNFSALQAHAPTNGIADGLGLLKNFLEHEMFVSAFFESFDLQFELVDFRGNHHVL